MSGIDVRSKTQNIIVPQSMRGIEVIYRTQKIVVHSSKSISIIRAGPPGPPGLNGDSGLTGPQGPAGPSSGDARYYGEGPPGLIIGASPGDEYVDALTGDLYRLE